MSTAQRVSRGFRRLGIFIAAVLFLNGLAIAVSLALYALVRAIGSLVPLHLPLPPPPLP